MNPAIKPIYPESCVDGGRCGWHDGDQGEARETKSAQDLPRPGRIVKEGTERYSSVSLERSTPELVSIVHDKGSRAHRPNPIVHQPASHQILDFPSNHVRLAYLLWPVAEGSSNLTGTDGSCKIVTKPCFPLWSGLNADHGLEGSRRGRRPRHPITSGLASCDRAAPRTLKVMVRLQYLFFRFSVESKLDLEKEQLSLVVETTSSGTAHASHLSSAFVSPRFSSSHNFVSGKSNTTKRCARIARPFVDGHDVSSALRTAVTPNSI